MRPPEAPSSGFPRDSCETAAMPISASRPTISSAWGWLAAPATTFRIRPSPGVDVRALLAGPGAPVAGGGLEQGRDPALGVGGVDHVVDLSVGGHVDSPSALGGGGGGGPEHALALLLVVERLQLTAHPQLPGALEAHRPELRGRPRNGEQGRLEATRR